MNFLFYVQSIFRVNECVFVVVFGECMWIGVSFNIGIYLLQFYVWLYLEGCDLVVFDMVIDCNLFIVEKLENVEIDVVVLEWWDNCDGC